MTDTISQTEVVTLVARLTQGRLAAFIEAEVVVPMQSSSGPLFRQVDVARLELLCDLAEQFDLAGDALGVVMALIDELHMARQRLRVVALALAVEEADVRHRVGARIAGTI